MKTTINVYTSQRTGNILATAPDLDLFIHRSGSNPLTSEPPKHSLIASFEGEPEWKSVEEYYAKKEEERQMVVSSEVYQSLKEEKERLLKLNKYYREKLEQQFIEATKVTKKEVYECILAAKICYPDVQWCHPDSFSNSEELRQWVEGAADSQKAIYRHMPTAEDIVQDFGYSEVEDWTREELVQNMAKETMNNLYQERMYKFKGYMPDSASACPYMEW